MKKSSLTLSVLALAFAASGAFAATDVSININGFVPAPPGVRVYVQGGRPYYREHGRVVYLEKERPGRHGRGHAYAYGHREHRGEHRGDRREEADHGGYGHGRHS